MPLASPSYEESRIIYSSCCKAERQQYKIGALQAIASLCVTNANALKRQIVQSRAGWKIESGHGGAGNIGLMQHGLGSKVKTVGKLQGAASYLGHVKVFVGV